MMKIKEKIQKVRTQNGFTNRNMWMRMRLDHIIIEPRIQWVLPIGIKIEKIIMVSTFIDII